MSIFDRLKNVAEKTAKDAARSVGNTIGTKRETFTFSALPESLAEMQALPEAKLDTPFATAALTVLALCAYAADRSTGTEMLNWLRGPRPLTAYDMQFIRDRLRGKDYLPRSYFSGATPENNYTPVQPLVVTVIETAHSNDQGAEGYITLYLDCGGADSPRPIRLRHKPSTGQWFLWEQQLLAGIRIPAAADPWS